MRYILRRDTHVDKDFCQMILKLIEIDAGLILSTEMYVRGSTNKRHELDV